ncbi:MAG: hypothetical protein ACYCSF_04260 [Acidimicrobiales bacterium]
MHPIERLRFIAQATGEPPQLIAEEAAWTLGELGAEDPAAVLTASRRLVERHPTCGPLWWVCAHLVACGDPVGTARRLTAELESDPTADRLAGALKAAVTRADILCATSPAALLGQALTRRGGHTVRLVAGYQSLRRELRELGSLADDATGYEVEEAEQALEGAAVLLVEPCIAASSGLLVAPGTASVVELAGQASVDVWALVGAGRLLSDELAEAARHLAGPELEAVAPQSFGRVLDGEGLGDVADGLGRTSCPPAAELAHGIARFVT